MCLASKAVHAIEGHEEEEQCFFLGSVTSDAASWTIDVNIRDKNYTFKLDTGADVTAVSQTVFNSIFSDMQQPVLQEVEKPLYGPGRTPLDVLGFTRLQLKADGKRTTQEVNVVKELCRPLLGLPAIIALGLFSRVNSIEINSIDMDTLKTSYPKLVSGLCAVKQPYTIKLKPDAVPFSLKNPRRIPLPLVGKVKEELQRMERMGVISRVEEPTDWCAGMVVMPKTDGKRVRLCVDLTGLNEYVCLIFCPQWNRVSGHLQEQKCSAKWMPTWGFGRFH